jgi:hypothetical protein
MLWFKKVIPIDDELNYRGGVLSKIRSKILFLKVNLDYDVGDGVIFS